MVNTLRNTAMYIQQLAHLQSIATASTRSTGKKQQMCATEKSSEPLNAPRVRASIQTNDEVLKWLNSGQLELLFPISHFSVRTCQRLCCF